MASVAELKKSFFAEIDKVEDRENLEKLRAADGFRAPGCAHTPPGSIPGGVRRRLVPTGA